MTRTEPTLLRGCEDDWQVSGRVLLVDDDSTVEEVVRRHLENDGMQVDVVGDGRAALDRVKVVQPDIVILDVVLPGLSGLEVCRVLRETSSVPIVMLSALGAETDRVIGLEVGADDYVTKPFSPRELTLRVRSVLRRAQALPTPAPSRVLRDDTLVIDVRARVVAVGGREVPLTLREFNLLAFLVANSQRAYTRAELLERVWEWSFGDLSTVTVHVRRLREKLPPEVSDRLVTVRRVGYRYDRATRNPRVGWSTAPSWPRSTHTASRSAQ